MTWVKHGGRRRADLRVECTHRSRWGGLKEPMHKQRAGRVPEVHPPAHPSQGCSADNQVLLIPLPRQPAAVSTQAVAGVTATSTGSCGTWPPPHPSQLHSLQSLFTWPREHKQLHLPQTPGSPQIHRQEHHSVERWQGEVGMPLPMRDSAQSSQHVSHLATGPAHPGTWVRALTLPNSTILTAQAQPPSPPEPRALRK